MSTFKSYVEEARTVFYNHKRQCHNGNYVIGCDECWRLFSELMAWLKPSERNDDV